FGRSEDRKARAIVCDASQLCPNPLAAAEEESFGFFRHRALLLLAFLSANRLGCVLNAFALVGLGRSVGPDIGCYLAHSLAVSARVVPHIARECLVSFFGATVTAPSTIDVVTSLLSMRLNAPNCPLAVSV